MIMNDLKDVLRMTATVFLFVSFFGLLVYADETQEQQVERLIKLLQGQNGDVRKNAASTLGSIGEGAMNAVPALIQLLQDQVSNHLAPHSLTGPKG